MRAPGHGWCGLQVVPHRLEQLEPPRLCVLDPILGPIPNELPEAWTAKQFIVPIPRRLFAQVRCTACGTKFRLDAQLLRWLHEEPEVLCEVSHVDPDCGRSMCRDVMET